MKVLLTRHDNTGLKQLFNQHKVAYMECPLFSVKYHYTPIDTRGIDGVIFTSVNAVKAIAEHAKDLVNTRCFAVGNSTKNALLSLGFKYIFTPKAGQNVDALIQKITSQTDFGTNLVYLRGNIVAKDIKPMLQNRTITEHVIYSTTYVKQLPTPIKNELASGNISHVVLFSKKAAEVFINLMLKNNLQNILANIVIVALSQDVMNVALKHCRNCVNFDHDNNKLLSLVSKACTTK